MNELDLCGLKCPLPALRTRRALARAAPGTRFAIRCTDPMAALDVPNLLRQSGDELTGQQRDGDVLVFYVRKAGG